MRISYRVLDLFENEYKCFSDVEGGLTKEDIITDLTCRRYHLSSDDYIIFSEYIVTINDFKETD